MLWATGKVYLVLGSDTAIWDRMSNTTYNNTYNQSLYTDPNMNAYQVMSENFRNDLTDSYGTRLKMTWWMMGGNIFVTLPIIISRRQYHDTLFDAEISWRFY
jgi:hypothetical protein